jgi:predicted nucleic acid-binding protein
MTESLVVETNWLVDVALERDVGSVHIWRLMVEEHLAIFVPAFALAEAIKRIEFERRRWNDLVGRVENAGRDLARSGVFSAQAESLSAAASELAAASNGAERQLWQTLDLATEHAELIELQRSTLLLARELHDRFRLEPGDAAVLASVVQARLSGQCDRFMSRDSAFAKADVADYLANQGVVFYRDPMRFLGERLPDLLQP